eukprot:Em0009g445a
MIHPGHVAIVVDVDLSPGLVSVSLGCLLELECYGAGTAIQWTKFPSSAPLGNTTNTKVTKSYAMNKWTTFLIFPYFTESLKGFYSCQIFAAVSNSMSVQLQFDPNPIQILNIPDLNISQYTVGDALTVGCQVTTCASQVTLTISPSLAVQQASITYMNTGENKVQNFVLAVNKNLAGTYMLTAEGKFSDGSVFSASQVFNIIGTPMPQVTTPSTATPSKGGSPASVAILFEAWPSGGVAVRATEQRKHEANEQGAGCLHGYGGIWCLGAKAIESLLRLASCLATSFNKAKAVVLIVLYGRLNLNLVRANTTAILTRCLAPDM